MKITIIGLGINPKNDLTLLALQTLKDAKKTFIVSTDDDARSLNELNIFPENLMDLYLNGEVDSNNYEHIYSHLLNAARKYEEIVVGLPGNPGLGVTLLQMLQQRSAEDSIELEVLPGLSSFDWMHLTAERDPLERGTIILDANRLLLFNFDIDPSLDCYIYHVCSVGTNKTWIENPKTDNNIGLLKNKLLQSYPRNHPVSLVSVSSKAIKYSNDQKDHILAQTTIENLEEMLESVTFDATLFVSGMIPKQIDEDFLSLISK